MEIRSLVNLFHILIVGGLFLYIGIRKENLSNTWFSAIYGLGLFIIAYHAFKIYGYLQADKSIWVNLIHVFIVGPLVAYIGYMGKDTPRKYFEVLLMLAFASIGYHLYYLLQ